MSNENIIDVSGQTVVITTAAPGTSAVPYWSHTYIYAYDDIKYATHTQLEFYLQFKKQFLSGNYLDLEGNNNYAFILLFDLLREEDLIEVERLLRILRKYYPKTKPYTLSFLADKFAARKDKENENRIRAEVYDEQHSSGLGTKYKPILKLDKVSEELLNKIWYPSNNFYDIPFCQLQIIKLFLAVRIELQLRYNALQQTRDQQFKLVADLMARKLYRYRPGSDNYNYCIQSSIAELYGSILKCCENALREHYGHKRKLSPDTYETPEVDNLIEDVILSKVQQIITKELPYVQQPDEETELELNTQSTNRWKFRLTELENTFKDAASFRQQVEELGRINQRNPSVENIFYEAAKIIAPKDRTTSLILYLQYVHHDLNSATFDNKPMARAMKKSLFDTDEQFRDFHTIVHTFIKNRNLAAAIESVQQLHLPKRKKIVLDNESIQETNRKYQDTVELLNSFLQDEEIPEVVPAPVRLQTVESSISLNESQDGLLQLFARNNFCLSDDEIKEYARSTGMFPAQLIESINEACYELIDDLLIEEEQGTCVINKNQYQNIFRQ